MRVSLHAALAGTALLLSVGAPAQQTEADAGASGEIVVTGQRDRDEQVRNFVVALTPAPSGAIGRFVDAVCPFTVGLTDEHNEQVSARIRKLAAAIDLPVAKGRCTPNAVVIITEDKTPLIEQLAKKRPGSFGALSHRQIVRLANSPGPAAAWRLETPVDSSGVPIDFDYVAGVFIYRTTEPATRLRNRVGRGFLASALVVETAALEGLTPSQLADYAAMRLFAELDPARLPAQAPSTILSILEAPPGTAVPITLTSWDFGLLRGLYSGRPDQLVSAQRGAIAREVRKELEKPAC